jgi:hypothetical protein
MFRATADLIAASDLSRTLQNTLWVVPVSQSIHIVALSVLFASAMLINLRILGVGIRGRSVSQLAATLLPWMWRALLMLLLTGCLQTLTEPVRQFVTPIFWGKMGLIILLALLTLWFSRTLRANFAQWDSAVTRPAVARLFAVVSTLGWLTVIVFGRFIGYVWSNYA